VHRWVRDRRENDARHLRARGFVDGFVEECFELSVGFELWSLTVEGRHAFGPGRSQSLFAIVGERAGDPPYELDALVRRELAA
jgi:hypothetical protein